MNSRTRFSLLSGVMVLIPALLCAQARPVELGIDGALAISFDRRTSTSFQLPSQSFRVGFSLSDAVSLEPAVSIDYLRLAETDADYVLGLGLGGVFHFVTDRTRSQPYVRPAAGLQLIASRGDAVAQFHASGALGVKLPVANQLAVRLEAGLQHTFASGLSGGNSIFAAVGLSFFTR